MYDASFRGEEECCGGDFVRPTWALAHGHVAPELYCSALLLALLDIGSPRIDDARADRIHAYVVSAKINCHQTRQPKKRTLCRDIRRMIGHTDHASTDAMWITAPRPDRISSGNAYFEQ